MRLTLDDIKKITSGAESITEENGLIHFERMKEGTINDFIEADWYEGGYDKRCRALAGIHLDFLTNTTKISIKAKNIRTASSRSFGYIDVLMNNILLGHFGSEKIEDNKGEFTIDLLESPSRVSIYLPNLITLDLEYIEIDDGSYFEKVKKDGTYLFYGDSITQGYDTRMPSLAYSAIVARAMNMDLINLAIGGSFFDYRILREKYECDTVFVAYGTNDWSHKSFERIQKDVTEFFDLLVKQYPSQRKIVILPYYRHDYEVIKDYGNNIEKGGKSFKETRELIRNSAISYNLEIIDSINFYPKEEMSFSDKHLHPNEFGNMLIASHIIDYLSK